MVSVSVVAPTSQDSTALTRTAIRQVLENDLGLNVTRLKRRLLKGKKVCWTFFLADIAEDESAAGVLQLIEGHSMGLHARLITKSPTATSKSKGKVAKKDRNSVSESGGSEPIGKGRTAGDSVELNSVHLKQQMTGVLSMLAGIFDMDTLSMATKLRNITMAACTYTKAKRCSVFFVDKKTHELYSRVFDQAACEDVDTCLITETDAKDNEDELEMHSQDMKQIRFSMKEGIAGYVAMTGESIHLEDAYKDKRFNTEVDRKTGFRTKSLACVPLIHNDDILGVLQAVNCQSADGQFSTTDVALLEEFSRLCSLALYNQHIHQRSVELETRGRLALEEIVRDSMPEEKTLKSVLAAIENSATITDLERFTFDVRNLTEAESVMSVIQVYQNLGIISFYNTTVEKMTRLVMTVKNNYREVPYHNWRHACEVIHSCYAIVCMADLKESLTMKRIGALLIAAMVHDVDHRGRTNTYIVNANSEQKMRGVYGTESTLEQHHNAVFLSLISPEDLNIFSDTDSELRDWTIGEVKKIILSTDLATHFPKMKRLEAIERLDMKKRSHVDLLVPLVMTCSDINASVRPWNNHQQVSQLIYTEFFEQGDAEKEMGLKPIPMMDREVAVIPEMQVDFYKFIALPAFKELLRHLPKVQVLFESAQNNAENWAKLTNDQKQPEGAKEVVLPSL